MYCPNCATPIDGVKFCRSCGSNVSLVPQAMSGQLSSQTPEDKLKARRRQADDQKGVKEPRVENAITQLFIGMGFVITAFSILALVPGGEFWWWSFLIPAFALIGGGLGKYLRWKEYQRKQTLPERPGNELVAYQSISQANPQAPAISAPTTSELVKPSSVTEHTTRHLE